MIYTLRGSIRQFFENFFGSTWTCTGTLWFDLKFYFGISQLILVLQTWNLVYTLFYFETQTELTNRTLTALGLVLVNTTFGKVILKEQHNVLRNYSNVSAGHFFEKLKKVKYMSLEKREANVYKFTVHFFTVIISLTHVFISMTIFLGITRTQSNVLKNVSICFRKITLLH